MRMESEARKALIRRNRLHPPNLFNTRNRAQHARKCKIVSRIFSLKSVHEYEPYVRPHAEALLRQWDKLARAEKCPGCTYPAFNTISDFAFGSPFGMLKATTDVLPLANHPSDAAVTSGGGGAEVGVFPILKVIRGRGHYTGSLGVLPTWV